MANVRFRASTVVSAVCAAAGAAFIYAAVFSSSVRFFALEQVPELAPRTVDQLAGFVAAELVNLYSGVALILVGVTLSVVQRLRGSSDRRSAPPVRG